MKNLIIKLALAAAKWVAHKAVDIGNALFNSAFDLANDVLSEAQKGLSEGEAEISSIDQGLEHDLDITQASADNAISASEKALDDIVTGVVKIAFGGAKALLDGFVAAMEWALSGLQAALDSIEQ